MFIYTDAVTVMLDLLMRVDDLSTTPELIALAVNLTQNDRIAEVGANTMLRPGLLLLGKSYTMWKLL